MVRRPPGLPIDRPRPLEDFPVAARLPCSPASGVAGIGQRRCDCWHRRLAYRVLEAETFGIGGHGLRPTLSLLVGQGFHAALGFAWCFGDRFAGRVTGLGLGTAKDVEEVMEVQPEFVGRDPEDWRRFGLCGGQGLSVRTSSHEHAEDGNQKYCASRFSRAAV